MKALILISLLILSCSAVYNHKITHAQRTEIENLRGKGTWASFFVKLAELSSLSQNPFAELYQALDDAKEDLGNKIEKAEDDFEKATSKHELEVKNL